MESKPKKEKRRKKKCHKLFFYITSTAKSYHKVLSQQAPYRLILLILWSDWLHMHQLDDLLHSRLRTLPAQRVLRFWKNLLKKKGYSRIFTATEGRIKLQSIFPKGNSLDKKTEGRTFTVANPFNFLLFCLCLICPVLLCLLWKLTAC